MSLNSEENRTYLPPREKTAKSSPYFYIKKKKERKRSTKHLLRGEITTSENPSYRLFQRQCIYIKYIYIESKEDFSEHPDKNAAAIFEGPMSLEVTSAVRAERVFAREISDKRANPTRYRTREG